MIHNVVVHMQFLRFIKPEIFVEENVAHVMEM